MYITDHWTTIQEVEEEEEEVEVEVVGEVVEEVEVEVVVAVNRVVEDTEDTHSEAMKKENQSIP